MTRGMKSSWSKEQIASGLRLAASGVPILEVTQMMDVSPEVFSGWKAEYADLLDKLVMRMARSSERSEPAKSTGDWRVAFLYGCVGGDPVESQLRECKLRYSVIENPAVVAAALLASGNIVGNLQIPMSWWPPASTSRAQFENAESEEDGSASDQVHVRSVILVSVQVLNPNSRSLQQGVFSDQPTLSGALSLEIDELRWRTNSIEGPSVEASIVRGARMKFSLEGILDGPIDAIRAFYTSPMDAILMGNFLIKKSGRDT